MGIREHIQKFSSNEHQIQRYLKFIETSNGSGDVSHHILPRSMFPEFDDLKEFEWNECKLSERHHFIAHFILAKLFDNKEMRYAFNMMSNFNKDNSKTYEVLREQFKDDLRKDLKERPQFSTTGLTTVVDKEGNRFSCATDDSRYLSGELVHFLKDVKKHYSTTKGQVTVKDKEGNTFNVSKTDPRWLSGEVVHSTKGNSRPDFSERRKNKVIAKDIEGNIFEVTKEEFLSRDDLYGIRKDLSKLRGTA